MFSSLFARLLSNTRKWDSFIENAFWKKGIIFPENYNVKTNGELIGILQLDDTSNALSPFHSLLLSYDSHPLWSIHPYELLILDIKGTQSLVSVDHQVLQPPHLCFY